jgi:hypothetical protein
VITYVKQNGNSLERFHIKFHLLSNIHEINSFSLFPGKIVSIESLKNF